MQKFFLIYKNKKFDLVPTESLVEKDEKVPKVELDSLLRKHQLTLAPRPFNEKKYSLICTRCQMKMGYMAEEKEIGEKVKIMCPHCNYEDSYLLDE